jgi:hypothetical protein
MIPTLPNGVKQRFTHRIRTAIQNYGLGVVFDCKFVHPAGVSLGEYLVAEIAQRKREQLGNLRRVVDQQDFVQAIYFFAAGPVPGSRGFLPAEGSRSITQMRPPAV